MAKETAIERANMNGIVGTVEQKIMAYDQIAAGMATLSLNGFDDFQKAKAGCWLADGARMHPAVFMQNHWCAKDSRGRIMIEPKSSFILGVLQSEIPNFQFKVLEETDERAKVWMKGPSGEYEVSYSVDDAKRQGLYQRSTAWQQNTREMCLDRAIKKCGKRVGAAVLMRLPVSSDGIELESGREEPLREPSSAEPVDAPEIPPVEPSVLDLGGDPVKALSDEVVRRYGRIGAVKALAKCSELYNDMVLAETGVNPRTAFRRKDEIGPGEASRLLTYLAQHPMNNAAAAKEPPSKPAMPVEGPAVEEHAQDDVPAAEDDDGGGEGPSYLSPYEKLEVTVERARPLFKRRFIIEAPEGSGKFFLIDAPTFKQAGFDVSVKLKEDGRVILEPARIEQLDRILSEMCDAAERGKRP